MRCKTGENTGGAGRTGRTVHIFRRSGGGTEIRMKRVVVTGMGAISPVGHTVAESWDALVNGKNGIAPITRFNTEDSKYKLAGEVKDFNPAEYRISLINAINTFEYTYITYNVFTLVLLADDYITLGK